MKKTWMLVFGVLCCFVLNACAKEGSNVESSLILSSSSVVYGEQLPITYSCDGEGVSPPLSWRGAPSLTQSYALIMHHDAPDGVHWYWTIYNIPAGTTRIDSGETVGELGTNSVNSRQEYAPPCSKGLGEKTYHFTLYALSEMVQFSSDEKVDRAMLLTAIQGTTLNSATLTVSYERETDKSKGGREPKTQPRARPETTQLQPPTLKASIDSPRCDDIRSSVTEAGFSPDVMVTCDNEYAYVMSSTYPDHEMMTGISGTNEQIPVPAEGYAAPIKLVPTKAKNLTTIDAAVGVAVNGVPIYDYSAQGELDVHEYDVRHDTLALGQLDNCGGHAGRGDDYHYHVSPTCMIDTMKNQGSGAIIGWGYDGYPLYGDKNPDGTEIPTGALDVCNGQADDTYGYRYQTSLNPPYIIQCLVGAVDTTTLPRVSPLSGDEEGIRADLRPPRGEVENLLHTIAKDGSRTMSYSYQGKEYFTTYRPSNKGDGCYNFEQKTISNGGKLESGIFCRRANQGESKPDPRPKPR